MPEAPDSALPVDVPTATPVDDDLTANQPGAQLCAKREEWRAEHPWKTRLGRLLGVHNQERAWRTGAVGERRVAKNIADYLEKHPEWRVVHGVPVGHNDADIDHVLLGPAGVVTVNSKYHMDKRVWLSETTLMVNGQRVPYLRNSRFEAKRSAKLLRASTGLDVPVHPVIVIVGADWTVKGRPADVGVVGRRELGRWLDRLPPVLSPDVVEVIWDAVRRRSTWQPKAHPSRGEPNRADHASPA